MMGLIKTILLFGVAALGFAYANALDVKDRYPPIDVLLWLCVAVAAALSARAVVETLRTDGKQGDSDRAF
jgi:hypothetical protein